jgi:hypothetical protein
MPPLVYSHLRKPELLEPQKVLVHLDSPTGAMEVGTRCL